MIKGGGGGGMMGSIGGGKVIGSWGMAKEAGESFMMMPTRGEVGRTNGPFFF